jgi:hypothetical protein
LFGAVVVGHDNRVATTEKGNRERTTVNRPQPGTASFDGWDE